MPDWSWITVPFPTPQIFRYHLLLKYILFQKWKMVHNFTFPLVAKKLVGAWQQWGHGKRSFVSRRKLNQPKIQPHIHKGGGKKNISIESVLT
jgi:hypothetical protein